MKKLIASSIFFLITSNLQAGMLCSLFGEFTSKEGPPIATIVRQTKVLPYFFNDYKLKTKDKETFLFDLEKHFISLKSEQQVLVSLRSLSISLASYSAFKKTNNSLVDSVEVILNKTLRSKIIGYSKEAVDEIRFQIEDIGTYVTNKNLDLDLIYDTHNQFDTPNESNHAITKTFHILKTSLANVFNKKPPMQATSEINSIILLSTVLPEYYRYELHEYLVKKVDSENMPLADSLKQRLQLAQDILSSERREYIESAFRIMIGDL